VVLVAFALLFRPRAERTGGAAPAEPIGAPVGTV
jgi:hypothetical protein